MDIKPIAIIKNDYKDKFAVPRQSGIAKNIESKIILEKEYSNEIAIKGLDEYSHLWLIWGFSKNIREKYSLTVRPPRLGGNTRMGVFATRSPYRPNNLGLSSVKLERIEIDKNNNPVIIVSGADLIDGTPIYDIKPYITFSDCHNDAISGIADTTEFPILEVNISDNLVKKIDKSKLDTLITILENDPRPAYQNDDNRIYGFKFASYEIKFNVKGNALTVIDIQNE
jgi:tRNA-Thr(GGU) m(6)t(6)A37 methyltransferase TsaA